MITITATNQTHRLRLAITRGCGLRVISLRVSARPWTYVIRKRYLDQARPFVAPSSSRFHLLCHFHNGSIRLFLARTQTSRSPSRAATLPFSLSQVTRFPIHLAAQRALAQTCYRLCHGTPRAFFARRGRQTRHQPSPSRSLSYAITAAR